jgi:hypothetical protein
LNRKETLTMSALKRVPVILGTVAAVATILSLLLTVATIFFPNWINDVTTGIAGTVQRTGVGTVRADYVGNQVRVFLYVSALVVFLGGAGIGTAYFWSSVQSAASVAAGRGKVRWLKFVLVPLPVILLVFLAIYLPRAVFDPTNEEELGRQLFLAAWSLRSVLGGLVLGLTYTALAGIIAYLGFLLSIQVPRAIRFGKIHRQLGT